VYNNDAGRNENTANWANYHCPTYYTSLNIDITRYCLSLLYILYLCVINGRCLFCINASYTHRTPVIAHLYRYNIIKYSWRIIIIIVYTIAMGLKPYTYCIYILLLLLLYCTWSLLLLLMRYIYIYIYIYIYTCIWHTAHLKGLRRE
jgi:hypothetical protein